MRRTHALAGTGLVTIILTAPAAVAGDFVLVNDVVFGLSVSDPERSIELVRGPATEGGLRVPSPWVGAFIQSVEFDNLGGLLHNPAGNLLAATFGTAAEGGQVYSYGTCVDCETGQLIGNTSVAGVTLTRLGGLSVSPDNTKIAVAGYDTGRVVVFDYAAGDGNGGGMPDLAGGRETTAEVVAIDDTNGTAWLDANTVISFHSNGQIWEVDATTMNAVLATTVDTVDGVGPGFTSLEYNPAISPYLFALYSSFTGATRNLLFVLDPADDYALVAEVDYSMSANTGREIALDADGNLYLSTFTNSIEVILNAIEPSSLSNNTSLDWYEAGLFGAFNGLDVAVGTPLNAADCPEDLDGDSEVGTTDLLQLLAAWGTADPVADLDGNGEVGTPDLLQLLAAWGACEG